MKLRAWLTLTLAGLVVCVFGAASVDASVTRDSSRLTFLVKGERDLFAAPQLKTSTVFQQLRATEARFVASAECVALCDLAASVEAHPFGRSVAATPFGTQDAWGNYRFTSELTTSHNRFGFTGHYWDKEASLYYAKARYYDPFTARFTQADSFLGTIDDPPSLHRYQYANENPTMYVDPTGHYSWSDLKGDMKWGKDFVGAAASDLRQNAVRRAGMVGEATFDAAGEVVVQTSLMAYDTAILASNSNAELQSKFGRSSAERMAGGESAGSIIKDGVIEMGLNGLTAGTYGTFRDQYAAVADYQAGKAAVAEVESRLATAAGGAILNAAMTSASSGALGRTWRGRPIGVEVAETVGRAKALVSRHADDGTTYLMSQRRINRFQAHVDRLNAQGMRGERLAELQGRVQMLEGGYVAAGPSKLRGNAANPGRGRGNQGLDRVFRKATDPNSLAVLESKYRAGFSIGDDPVAELSGTNMGRQMSQSWMEGNIFKMITGPHGLRVNSLGWELGSLGYRRFVNVMNAGGESALYGLRR